MWYSGEKWKSRTLWSPAGWRRTSSGSSGTARRPPPGRRTLPRPPGRRTGCRGTGAARWPGPSRTGGTSPPPPPLRGPARCPRDPSARTRPCPRTRRRGPGSTASPTGSAARCRIDLAQSGKLLRDGGARVALTGDGVVGVRRAQVVGERALLAAVDELRAVVEDHVPAIDPLAEAYRLVDVGDGGDVLEHVVLLGQVDGVAVRVVATEHELLRGRSPAGRSRAPASTDDRRPGQGGDAIDRGAAVQSRHSPSL